MGSPWLASSPWSLWIHGVTRDCRFQPGRATRHEGLEWSLAAEPRALCNPCLISVYPSFILTADGKLSTCSCPDPLFCLSEIRTTIYFCLPGPVSVNLYLKVLTKGSYHPILWGLWGLARSSMKEDLYFDWHMVTLVYNFFLEFCLVVHTLDNTQWNNSCLRWQRFGLHSTSLKMHVGKYYCCTSKNPWFTWQCNAGQMHIQKVRAAKKNESLEILLVGFITAF